jgi:hypothetical protein
MATTRRRLALVKLTQSKFEYRYISVPTFATGKPFLMEDWRRIYIATAAAKITASASLRHQAFVS